MAIRNNSRDDDDAGTRTRFEERAWNYPVARFLDADGKDLIPRIDGDWRDARGLVTRMVAALEKAGRPVPPYLRLLAAEVGVEAKETACFAMYCYWTGEKNLSGMDGVLATRIGMMGRHEVIEVDYDATVVSFDELLAKAKASCGKTIGVYARTDAQVEAAKAAGVEAKRTDDPVETGETVQKHFLKRAPHVVYLPMTEAQAARTNALAAAGEDVTDYLSPTQIAWMERMGRWMKAEGEAFAAMLETLEIDRTPKGIAAYAASLEAALAGLEAAMVSED